jgi:hypothetical protein
MAEARFVHGHLLKPGDVARTSWGLRCAQPPYDRLPIPRADIPAGTILSREADAWIHEDDVKDVALPLYEGRMIGQFDFSQKGWVSGKGRSAVWRDIPWERKVIEPQYLMASKDYLEGSGGDSSTLDTASVLVGAATEKLSLIDITSSTNERTTFTAIVPPMPHGHSAPVLVCSHQASLSAVMNSVAFDWAARLRLSGVHLVWAILEEMPLPSGTLKLRALGTLHQLTHISPATAVSNIAGAAANDRSALGSPLLSERLRLAAVADSVVAAMYLLEPEDMGAMLWDCDSSTASIAARASGRGLDPKGFWRIDKSKDPELRHTVLTLVAFHDLEEKIRAHGGDRDAGIEAFLSQNRGEGWMLPETLRLADYGLGHDKRAEQEQPVASRLGPRFCDWQLTQSAEESWRECHLHARNLLGEQGYAELLDDIRTHDDDGTSRAQSLAVSRSDDGQESLFS